MKIFVHVLLRPGDPTIYPMCADCLPCYAPQSEAVLVFNATEVRAMDHGLYRTCWSCGVELVPGRVS